MRVLSTVVLAVAACACGAHVDVEAEPGPSVIRPIIGGHVAVASELLSTVAVLEDGVLLCTGTLLAPTLVVTAAHCLEDITGAVVPANRVSVAAGVLTTGNIPAARLHAVQSLARHEGYPGIMDPSDPQGLGAWHDVAVLLLATRVTEQNPVSLLDANVLDTQVAPNTPLTISGYGDDESLSNGVLRSATTPFIRHGPTEFVAGVTGQPDTCPGDSGGPVYVTVGGRVFLLGATSRAFKNATQPCGDGGIYTLLPAYLSWITQHANGALGPGPGSSSSGGASASASQGASASSAAGTSANSRVGVVVSSTSHISISDHARDPVGRAREVMASCACAALPGAYPAGATALLLLLFAPRLRRRHALYPVGRSGILPRA